jgi:hypothetical protein
MRLHLSHLLVFRTDALELPQCDPERWPRFPDDLTRRGFVHDPRVRTRIACRLCPGGRRVEMEQGHPSLVLGARGLPLVAPVSTALLCIILAWNEFLFALVHSSVNTVTVWVSITSFKSAMGLFIAKMSEASILAIGPVLRSRLGRAAPLGACDGLA